jgi:hypothetical protein
MNTRTEFFLSVYSPSKEREDKTTGDVIQIFIHGSNGVVNDKEVNLEETETSLTLGGVIKYTYIHQCHWFGHRLVAWSGPMNLRTYEVRVSHHHIVWCSFRPY